MNGIWELHVYNRLGVIMLSTCLASQNQTLRWLAEFGCRVRGALDSAKNHKRQRRKRQSVTAKREKSQTPKFV